MEPLYPIGRLTYLSSHLQGRYEEAAECFQHVLDFCQIFATQVRPLTDPRSLGCDSTYKVSFAANVQHAPIGDGEMGDDHREPGPLPPQARQPPAGRQGARAFLDDGQY